DVHLLGCVDFESALFLQQRLVYEVRGRTDRYGGLLICEHPPVITVGREGSYAHFHVTEQELRSRQLAVKWLNRGGGCLSHAPGQLAIYPILPLDRLQIGLAEYRDHLELAVQACCDTLRIHTTRRPDVAGLWCRNGKFAHVGSAVKWWVSYHGVFLDVCTPPQFLDLVQTDELNSRGASLASLNARALKMPTVRERLIHHVSRQFGYRDVHLHTGHPLLRRTRQPVHGSF
ncbi:MAG: lipoyl(octanoyl) transferase, partial [Planctomycetaceae bacterium]